MPSTAFVATIATRHIGQGLGLSGSGCWLIVPAARFLNKVIEVGTIFECG